MSDFQSNYETSALAESVEVITRNGRPFQLLVDGKPFPWTLASDNLEDLGLGDDSMTVSLRLIASPDRVAVREVSQETGGAR